jgi:hypothetical protein
MIYNQYIIIEITGIKNNQTFLLNLTSKIKKKKPTNQKIKRKNSLKQKKTKKLKN